MRLWNQLLEPRGVMVGERLDIEIDIEAVKQEAAAAAQGEAARGPPGGTRAGRG